MNTHPLVSVLVTPYNQKEYIRQTLDSILQQKCTFEFEVLIGEDCSTDGTREICIEYAEKYPDQIILCLNEKNKGLINNYFDIFEKARGRYIADCGGDDFWMSNTQLQSQVDLLETHPNVSLVSGNWLLLNQKSGQTERVNTWIPEDWYQPDCYGQKAVADYLNNKNIPRISLSASCIRASFAKSFYDTHRSAFRGEDVVCEDLPLTLGLLMQGPFYISKDLWLTYRVLEKSLSHAARRYDYIRGFAFRAYNQTLAFLRELNLDLRLVHSYVYRHYNEFSFQAFLHADPEFSKQIAVLPARYRFKGSMKAHLFHALNQTGTGRLLRLLLKYKHTPKKEQ